VIACAGADIEEVEPRNDDVDLDVRWSIGFAGERVHGVDAAGLTAELDGSALDAVAGWRTELDQQSIGLGRRVARNPTRIHLVRSGRWTRGAPSGCVSQRMLGSAPSVPRDAKLERIVHAEGPALRVKHPPADPCGHALLDRIRRKGPIDGDGLDAPLRANCDVKNNAALKCRIALQLLLVACDQLAGMPSDRRVDRGLVERGGVAVARSAEQHRKRQHSRHHVHMDSRSRQFVP
jgi:hypothetical protein